MLANFIATLVTVDKFFKVSHKRCCSLELAIESAWTTFMMLFSFSLVNHFAIIYVPILLSVCTSKAWYKGKDPAQTICLETSFSFRPIIFKSGLKMNEIYQETKTAKSVMYGQSLSLFNRSARAIKPCPSMLATILFFFY